MIARATIVPQIAGISGGRTSGMMAAEFCPSALLCFQNTGLEHPKTYEFLLRLADHIKREIIWLEWRPGPRPDSAPKEFGFQRVPAMMPRAGEPSSDAPHLGFALMLGMLRALRSYRASKGEGPVVPWARQRLCTSHLKHRVKDHYVARQLRWDAYDTYVGLRRDEPDRVLSLHSKATHRRGFLAPLNKHGITEPDVRTYWRKQPFDLEIESYQGNCTGCFLKDQSDLSRLLLQPETNARGWIALQDEFPGFGGKRQPTYAQHLSEAPLRLITEQMLNNGLDTRTPGLSRRNLLVVKQEEKRFAEGAAGFSCSCESSIAGDEEEDAA